MTLVDCNHRLYIFFVSVLVKIRFIFLLLLLLLLRCSFRGALIVLYFISVHFGTINQNFDVRAFYSRMVLYIQIHTYIFFWCLLRRERMNILSVYLVTLFLYIAIHVRICFSFFLCVYICSSLYVYLYAYWLAVRILSLFIKKERRMRFRTKETIEI